MISQADIRVLHVDDESDFAEMTAEFLKREGDSFTVKTATSASEGLERLSHDDFDCIVSDYDMPGQNGIDFLKSVRKEAPNLPFVLFTGKGSEEIACEAISAGVTDYLQKKSATDQYTVLANRLRNAVRQHRAEKDRKRQRKAIETAQEGISILNEDGEFIYVNQAYADMYGYEPGEMNGEHWELIYPDDETAIAQDVILPTVAEDGYWSGKTTGLRADGTTFLEDHTVAQTDTGELICSVRDRSVEQEAGIEMQSAAMEAAMDGISILNRDGEYIYMNQAHADVFEYDADELLGSTWQRLYDDDEIARIEQEIFPVLEREGEWRGETVGKRRDGSPVHQEITLSLLDDGKLICTNRDITERKEREQELEQANTVLRTIVENLPMGVLVEDTERDVLIANDELGKTLGVPIDSEELIGRDCATAVEELRDLFTDPDEFIQGITERLERREPVQNEEILLADGRVLERDYVPYTLPQGEASLWLYRDITARKQQRQELKRSNRFLQETQEVAHVGGWEYNIQSESLQWSDEVYRIHGLPLDTDVTTEDALNFYHPDDRDTIREAFDRLTTEGKQADLELRIITADGDVRWVSALGEPVYEGDKIVAVRGTFQDITERKEREQELQMVREQFEQFAGNVQNAFFLLPADYSETEYVNPAIERIYGVTPEEAYDDLMVWLRHVHPDDKDELLADVEAQEDETTDWPIEQEFRIDHPDRGVRWVQARLNVIADENDDPSRVTGVTTDITERIEREQKLEEKTEELEQLATKYESQYRTLFEEAPVMTVLTRSEDGQPIIEDCNNQFVETLGYDSDTIIGSELAEFYAPDSAERLRSQGYSQALTGRFTREKRELLTIDGEVIEALLRAVPRRTADGNVVGTVAMYIDISERESVKRANERLEEFTSVVSHDLRNPLNVATGRLELAAEECDSAHLDDLGEALNRMETLIDDLLTLAREGKEVTDAQPVDLAAVVNGCWENVETNQAKLITNIDQGVWADRSRLKQVFENLFRNAVKHGWADVTVTIGGLDDGFYIEDDGPGIPSDERDAIFEAGYSQSTNGTGFGLSIVKQVVDAHGWHICVTDGTGGGARFEITNIEFVDT